MKLLLEMMTHATDKIERDGVERIESLLCNLKQLLHEGFIDSHRGDLEKKFDIVEDKFIAARRALGIINKSNFTPEEKREERKKVMSRMNVFRHELYKLMKEMGMSAKEIDYHKNRIDMDREFGKPSEFPNYKPQKNTDQYVSSQDAANMLKISLPRLRQFRLRGGLKNYAKSPDDAPLFSVSELKRLVGVD